MIPSRCTTKIMSAESLTILALDFNGIICDGLIEYFQTTKRTYSKIWTVYQTSIDDLASSFYRLRAVIETGWEMPVLLRALVLGTTEEEILQNWSSICQRNVESEQLVGKEVAQKLDSVRNRFPDNMETGCISAPIAVVTMFLKYVVEEK